MDGTNRGARTSDALVLFGVTGDLAHKKIFPALYAMAKRGVLDVPVVGVASSTWALAQLRKRATDSIKTSGRIDDRPALRHLLSLLRYVAGDYNDPGTFKALKQALGGARRPAHYPPATGPANYLRFRISPGSAVALAARVKHVGKEFVGDQRELYLLDAQPGEEAPYERLLGDAMTGDGALFAREDSVEAAWAVVDPVLTRRQRAMPYKRGSWGPKQADALLAAGCCWHNPMPCRARA